MKIRLLFFFLSCVQYFSIAQSHTYQVKLDGHRIGSFNQSVESDQNIHTFSQLNIQIKTFQDTIQYNQHIHFVESDAGLLNSIEWFNVLADTISYQVLINGDSVIRIGEDGKQVIQTSQAPLIGPEKIKKMCRERLDSIGSSIKYSTFAVALNQSVEIQRELIGHTFENAQKQNIVKESIDSTHFTIGIYDQEFNLISTDLSSHFGNITLSRVQKAKSSQFFEPDYFDKNLLRSNIRFVNPQQISAIKVSVHGTNSYNQLSGEQKVNVLNNTNDPIPLPMPENFNFSRQEHLWKHAKANAIVDSLLRGNLDQEQTLVTLIDYSRTMGKYASLALCQLSLAAGIPARLVYGYSYDRWFWHPRYWVEVAQNGRWTTIDMTSEIPSNPALKIALRRNPSSATPNQAYFVAVPKLDSIRVESFEIAGRKYSVSNQVLPYYFEKPVYENEGLGIRFNVPDGFEIIDDGTKKPSDTFLVLQTDDDELITCSQILTQTNESVKIEAKNRITQHTKDPSTALTFEKKLNLWHGSSGRFGAIAILQGSSLIFMAIDHEDPEFIVNTLLKKNLHLKY